MKSTKQIEKEYNVTRQTLHNWISEGLLPAPKKDFRNWYIWTETDEQGIKEIIDMKTKYNNLKKIDETPLNIGNRRYLGSKQKMLDFLDRVVTENTEGVKSVADIFGGTGIVSDMFRRKGAKVIINDILHSNTISYNTWFGNDKIDYSKVCDLIAELNNINSFTDNYFSKNFGDKYFSLENARKIGAIREKIESYDINKREKSFLLTSLIYAMDKVANTVGHYDAYRKKLDSFTPIHLKVPQYNENNNNQIYCEDANELVKKIKADLVYIDTPYNSRQYGDAYHLLENVIDWKKPEVTGVACKMVDRAHIKSNYSTSKAPEAFQDLIENINAKYILVSYNNMAKKGNGRSNAKISNEEIIEILSKKGSVKVFETPFKVFTTGKTNIEDHKELLYLCEVFNSKLQSKKNKATEISQSAINYTGGKFKLLPQLLPLFPKNINRFFDVFAGGANVTINVEAEQYFLNDINKEVVKLYDYFSKNDYAEIINVIENLIKEYGLSNTKKLGYEYYNVNSSQGLKDVNKESYIRLRNDFNHGIFDSTIEPLVFYLLIVYGFNNQIRFNRKNQFNMPPGKRDFNQKMVLKLKNFLTQIQNRDIIYSSTDFRSVLQNNNFERDDFIYLDPPYLISTAAYNENGGWTEKDELDLLALLDELDNQNIKFALSNVTIHKGKRNDILIDWSRKYNVHTLNYNYNNSNYQSNAKAKETIEILITNY
ncbi:Dam family site-specific DNA-(adenine-N6)-methyltransferase [Streptococcus hillyeri]|uniref:Site-specific DNA-methyltransferase (adenine-specific) n=1 Tax=Streptococcus hillyeri TaxID=2282420 RepID=A0A3L9DYM2_9STRE|nr:Dam family site-specific DNA-(adenine-N6)-methyltransferase [Streptococcus hillyeri]RLY05374.1 Dam family site-specific DNA-(adenine-N6)-methyltransferase [Streptococcus hillyeri]